MITPEGRIKKAIRDWLRRQGAYVFSPVQQGYGSSTLDLLVCYQGWFVGIEVKAPNGKTTLRQDEIIAEIKRASGVTIVARSLQDVIDYFSIW